MPRFGDYSVSLICLVEEVIACLSGRDAIRNRLQDLRVKRHDRLLRDLGEEPHTAPGAGTAAKEHGDLLLARGNKARWRPSPAQSIGLIRCAKPKVLKSDVLRVAHSVTP